MHSKRLQPLLLACFSLLILSATAISAKPPLRLPPLPDPIVPTVGELPLPTPAPPAVTDLRPSATFTFADATQIKTQSTPGRFRLVGLHLTEVVDIALQFPAVLLKNPATVQPLDGGKIITLATNPGGVSGVTSIRFQAGNKPGLYRVLVSGLGANALLQFWVTDPNNPKPKPPVLNPGH